MYKSIYLSESLCRNELNIVNELYTSIKKNQLLSGYPPNLHLLITPSSPSSNHSIKIHILSILFRMSPNNPDILWEGMKLFHRNITYTI